LQKSITQPTIKPRGGGRKSKGGKGEAKPRIGIETLGDGVKNKTWQLREGVF